MKYLPRGFNAKSFCSESIIKLAKNLAFTKYGSIDAYFCDDIEGILVGCIPINVDSCPEGLKKWVRIALSLEGVTVIYSSISPSKGESPKDGGNDEGKEQELDIDFTIFPVEEYYRILDKIYDYAKTHLTTENLARLTLEALYYKTKVFPNKVIYVGTNQDMIAGYKQHLGDENVILYSSHTKEKDDVQCVVTEYSVPADYENISSIYIYTNIEKNDEICFSSNYSLCNEFDFPGYNYYKNKDIMGSNIMVLFNVAEAPALHEMCNLTPDANAFNTAGYIKKTMPSEVFVPCRYSIYIKKKTVAFFLKQLTERGTENAIFDYAYYNKMILNNHSVIIMFYPEIYKQRPETPYDKEVHRRFEQYFQIIYISDFSDIAPKLKAHKVDVFYTLTNGDPAKDNVKPYGTLDFPIRTIHHCVFEARPYIGRNIVDLVISRDLNRLFSTNFGVLPHIVHLPHSLQNMRKKLGIPESAVVFGRYGGEYTFDMDIVKEAIQDVLLSREDIYFLFMNTACFFVHPRIIYLPKTVSPLKKRHFINTCDAMIHARCRGETFGISVAEFSICKKPVITYSLSPERAHLDILGETALLYDGKQQAYEQMMNFKKGTYVGNDKMYEQFSPENIMKLFAEFCFSTPSQSSSSNLEKTVNKPAIITSIPSSFNFGVNSEYKEELALTCNSVLELGIRRTDTANIFLKFLSAKNEQNGQNRDVNRKKRYTGIAFYFHSMEEMRKLNSYSVKFDYRVEKFDKVEIKENYDLLFIDAIHTYSHVLMDLMKFSCFTEKYIHIKNTEPPWAFKDDKEYAYLPAGNKQGINAAITDFLLTNTDWIIKEKVTKGAGVVVLERVKKEFFLVL